MVQAKGRTPLDPSPCDRVYRCPLLSTCQGVDLEKQLVEGRNPSGQVIQGQSPLVYSFPIEASDEPAFPALSAR